MQVKAVYNKGQLELPPGIELSRDVFDVQVEIPAEVIHTTEEKRLQESKTEISSRPFSVRRQIDAILGGRSRKTPDEGLNAYGYKQLWHKHLEEKHLGDT